MKRIVPCLLAAAMLFSIGCASAEPAVANTGTATLQASAWAVSELTDAQQAGLVTESLSGADLTRPISRLEFAGTVMALYDVLGGTQPDPSTTDIRFIDCQDDAVTAALNLGIVSGFEDGTFRPDAQLTREQAAVMLARTCQEATGLTPAGSSSFADGNQIAAWARDAVGWMSGAGVVRGVGENRFLPKSSVTRQEAILMANRLYDRQQPGSGDFSADLYRAAANGENPLLSPVSAALCLSMAQAGASGDTRSQFDRLLSGVDADALLASLQSKADGPQIEVANSVWFDDAIQPKQDYVNSMKSRFSAQVEQQDLGQQSTVAAVNRWVSDKTHGLIPTILDQPDPDAAAILLNALYFKADWQQPFLAENTSADDFTNGDGAVVQTDFLHAYRLQTPLIETPEATGVVLPYAGGDWSFIALLPKEGADAADLTSSDFSQLLHSAKDGYVNLSLPKFEVSSTCDLTVPLQSMGLTDAFRPGAANFSPMAEAATGDLYISQVLQKTYLRVDEKGTEAAAVTGTMMSTTSLIVEEPVVLTFDRPFAYCIWNESLQMPLFLGVTDTLGQ